MNSYYDLQNMDEGFYRAFEDRFRGTREEIKSRLAVYLPFIEPLKKLYEVCTVIDLGCGRGEWLELVTDAGMAARGVDLDDAMLAACRERNLSVETGDAISFLKSLPDQSQVVVSGFHIIEHIEFSDLQVLVQEAFRILKPAGLLILETPNPENIVVSSTNFYLDPTHLHPVPPQLLSFLTEHYGFYRNKVLRLQEPFNPKEDALPNLFNVLYGVSPDYSVIAQKRATDEQLVISDATFNKEYGFSLETLSKNFDAQFIRAFNNIHYRINDIQAERDRIQTELDDVYQSRSWRITSPLRKTADLARGFSQQIRHRLSTIRTLPRRMVVFLFKMLGVTSLKNWIKRRFPRQWQKAASKFNAIFRPNNGYDASYPFSLTQFSTELSQFQAGNTADINIDEIMERIRAEVKRVKAQSLQEKTDR